MAQNTATDDATPAYHSNRNGVLVEPGVGFLETREDCRRYVQEHLHRGGAILKFSTDSLPNGHNY